MENKSQRGGEVASWKYIAHFDHYRYAGNPNVVLQFRVVGPSDHRWVLWVGTDRYENNELGSMDVKKAQSWAENTLNNLEGFTVVKV